MSEKWGVRHWVLLAVALILAIDWAVHVTLTARTTHLRLFGPDGLTLGRKQVDYQARTRP